MKYRRFGKVDFEASALGFGCMRLPTKGSESDIDEPKAVEMIRYPKAVVITDGYADMTEVVQRLRLKYTSQSYTSVWSLRFTGALFPPASTYHLERAR